MSAGASALRLTYEDYLLLPEDGRRHELIYGEHIVTPAPSRTHQEIVSNLLIELRGFARHEQLGTVIPAPFDVLLSAEDVVQPDLLFVATAHAERLTERALRGTPDLVVEVTSESSRRVDEVLKRKLYEAHGVEEYWVVDPETESVKVYRRRGTRFERVGELMLEREDVLSSPLLPGLSIPLRTVFSSTG
ncbi:MAG: Uma2 family endonuclease [Thermoanaerobaculaceae bacterium]